MNRINGYINLEEILASIGVDTTSFDTISKSDLIKDYDDIDTSVVFKFPYNNEEYYYKYELVSNPYSELIGSFLLDDLNIGHVSYDLAILKDKKGNISKNFRKENVKYISGLEILENYTTARDSLIGIYNNLEDIWRALELYFKDYKNRDEIVANLMDKLVDLFIFDILVSNSDRNPTNWTVTIDNDKVDLGLIYDNARIGLNTRNNPVLAMNVDETVDDNLYANLEHFLKISDASYRERLEDRLKIISEENIINVFDRIKDKTGTEMSNVDKEGYLKFFNRHREKILEIMENTNRKSM